MNIQAILGIFRPCFLFLFFMENDFFKPTHPTKVWKIPYFFLKASLNNYIFIKTRNLSIFMKNFSLSRIKNNRPHFFVSLPSPTLHSLQTDIVFKSFSYNQHVSKLSSSLSISLSLSIYLSFSWSLFISERQRQS